MCFFIHSIQNPYTKSAAKRSRVWLLMSAVYARIDTRIPLVPKAAVAKAKLALKIKGNEQKKKSRLRNNCILRRAHSSTENLATKIIARMGTLCSSNSLAFVLAKFRCVRGLSNHWIISLSPILRHIIIEDKCFKFNGHTTAFQFEFM